MHLPVIAPVQYSQASIGDRGFDRLLIDRYILIRLHLRDNIVQHAVGKLRIESGLQSYLPVAFRFLP